MLPAEFLQEIKEILGDGEFASFLDSYSRPAYKVLRLNPLKRAAAEAAEAFSDGCVPWEENGRYIKEGTRPGAGIGHAAGAFYMQDASAMAPVAVLDPKPGETVLDLCAAPGGKSGQIAGRMAGRGVLVSNEYVKSRARILRSTLERLGVTNARVTNASPDAFAKACPDAFDAVLVDAPCSGEGMFRRLPEAASEWTPASPAACADRQAKVLDSAAPTVRPGGRLVYSTCTFNRMENEFTIRDFLSRHPDFVYEDFTLPGVGRSEQGCLRLWPHRIMGEGHFVAKLRRRGDSPARKKAPFTPSAAALEALRLLKKDCVNRLPAEGRLTLRDGVLTLGTDTDLDFKGIYTLCDGLILGTLGKNYIEPSHSLAIACEPEDALRTVDVDEKTAALYMEGEAFPREGENGWSLVCCGGLPLGWGKVNGGVCKNHLPKGLRLRGGHALKIEEEI